MKPHLLLTLFCMIFLNSFTQDRIKWMLLDSITGEPVPYASVKVKNKPLGFYADENGFCEFVNTTQEDTLIISCVGYQSKLISLDQVFVNNEIKLIPKTILLDEITIRYKNDEFLIDYPIHKEDYFLGSSISVENAYKIEIPQRKTGNKIQIIQVKIKMKKADTNNPSRLHVYDLGEDGMPGEELLGKDIQITSKNISGKEFSVDLSQYNITTCDSIIFIGMEWLGKIEPNNKHEGPRIAITHEFEVARTYARTILDKNHQWVLLNVVISPYKKPANMIVSVTYK